MSVLAKFKESLSPEDFVQLEESITALIEEKAKTRADLIVEEVKAELENLAEEFTKQEVEKAVAEKTAALEEEYQTKSELFKETAIEKIQEMAEGYVAKEVEEKVSELKAQLEEEYAEKVQSLEENVVDKLDKFLDLEISSKISDELLESVAINETYAPLIKGIQHLFESQFVALDSEGSQIVESATSEVKTLKTKLNESLSEKIALAEKVEKLQTGLLIATKTEGLTESQKERVLVMLEGKGFEEVSEKIDTVVDIITESEDVLGGKEELDENDNTDVFAGYVEPINEHIETKTDDVATFKFNKVNYLLEH
jgi:vacuolar-type H+-ATPase subunit H